jgi:hypothetical protein
MSPTKPQNVRQLKDLAGSGDVMNGLIAAAAAAVLFTLSSTVAPAQELPTYECDGYPVTPMQLQVLGSGHVQERASPSTLERDGMPASPHQLAVLRRTNGTAP